MNSQAHHIRSSITQRALLQSGVLILAYIVLLLLLPAGRDYTPAYNIDVFQYKTIKLALALPVLISWVAAFLGYAALKQYANTIRETSEGAHFDRLATGAGWLAWSLPVSAIITLLLSAWAIVWPGFYPSSVIMGNYIDLLLPLVAFSIIGTATRALINGADIRLSVPGARTIVLLFLAIGVTYCLLTFRQFNTVTLGATDNSFFLPVWLMVLSVIIPYLYAWFIGLLAVYEITLYSQKISGILYRRALRLVAGGLIIVIGSSIALQYFNAVLAQVDRSVLDYTALPVLLFHILNCVGFILLIFGATRLKKIEEI